MTGTDSLFPGLVAGFAVHRELQELVKVGLTPYEALRSSTTEPFEYLGEMDRSGTITVGKYTDLVLVNENPLKDISGASKISGVLVRGHWIGVDDIAKRMKAIETRNMTSMWWDHPFDSQAPFGAITDRPGAAVHFPHAGR